MKYKKTKTCEKIEDEIDKFINYMRMAGKTEFNLYLTTKQHDEILKDRNKAALNIDPNHKEIKALKTYRNYPVRIYNP